MARRVRENSPSYMTDHSSRLLKALRAQFGDQVQADQCQGPVAAFSVPDSGADEPLQLRFALTEKPPVPALFLAEREIVRTLRHKNIVAVLHEGVFEGHAFYAVRRPYALLDEKLSGQRLPLIDVLALLRQLAAALAHCHENGVVHGAIDPFHIVSCPEGVMLDGFHRAAFIKVFGSLYQQGCVLGTPLYFSPELCTEQTLDARSDIYSLGITAFEALTGEPPFLRAVDWVRARLEQDPPTPKLKSAKEARVYSVIRQMLAREPAARYQSASALWRALDELPE